MKENDLADAVRSLTCAVIALGDLIRHQNNNQAVLCRIAEMEKRLTDAIKENAHISPGIESAAMRAQSALDRLDASIPDKK